FSDPSYGDYTFSQDTYTEEYRHVSTNIINTYGDNRYNADKWYVIGLGYKARKCEKRSRISVFTPVHEYLAFIHATIDHTQRSAVTFKDNDFIGTSANAHKDDGFSFSFDLPIKIPKPTVDHVVETTGVSASSLSSLVSNGNDLASKLAVLKGIDKILDAVKTVFELLNSTVKKFLNRSVINDIVDVFRKKRSVDTDIDSILQLLFELKTTSSDIVDQIFNEIEKKILSIETFIKQIEEGKVDRKEVQIVNERIFRAGNELNIIIKGNEEEITQVQKDLDKINGDIRNLGGIVVTEPQVDNVNDLLAAAEAAKITAEAAAKKAAKKAAEEAAAQAEVEKAAAAMKFAEEAAKKAAEEAAIKAAEEEAARKEAEMAAAVLAASNEADRKEAEEAAKKAEEEAAKKVTEAEAARKAAEEAAAAIAAAEEKARLAEEAAAKLASELEAARKAAEEAKEAERKAEEAAIKKAKEEEARIKAEEEAARIKAEEEEARIKAEAEEEARIKAEAEEAAARIEAEEAARIEAE
ncbi:unnamed protein product, partial [Meganyctiphanes norvegica]